MIKKLTWIICLLGNSIFLQAQLQSPDQFLPHALGENFTPHHLLVDYFEHVAANSELVKLKRFGYTSEDRPLLQAFISTPENLARLESIRINNLRRTGLMEGAVDPALDVAIVWLSYSVHGNEAAGSESSMGVIYELTRPDNMDTKAWLKNTVVIMDPSINPDGYSRYTHWYRRVTNKITNTNPAAREHDEPWPGGRVNHYMFDLNRDWAWQTQIESQQRLKEYRQWYPHIHADLHEQSYNDPYYFAPAARPYHEYLTDWQAKFQIEIGKNHAKYFDKEGWLYFTKEVFDLLYPSYGDTYPMFTGAIGMTYEQGGSGRAGKAIIRDSGDTLSLKDRVVHHLTTSLSTVEMASKNAPRLIQQFSEFFQTAQTNPKGQYKTYIIKGSNPAGKLKRLTALLDKNGIQYGRAKAAMNNLKVLDYQNGQQTTISLSTNDLLISAYQPLSVLTQTLFDPSAKIEDSLTYDITAWALPYAYGLTTFASAQKIELITGYTYPSIPTNNGTEQAYAYLVPWESVGDAQFLAQLLRKGIKVRYATAPFTIEGVSYEPGTLIMNRADNRKNVSFDATVKALAQSQHQVIKGITTGFSEHGPDLGSDAMHVIQTPEVVILSEEGVSPNAFGQVWYYFEQVLNYPTNIIYKNDFARLNLDDYNLLVLPSGNYNFSDNELKKLSTWLGEGGRLIAQGAALQAFEGKSGFGLKSFESKEAEEKNKKAQEEAELSERLLPYAGGGRREISQSLPGAIFRLQMDNSHPLGYGLGHQYFTLKTGTDAYPYQTGMSNVGIVGKKPLTSGFVGIKALEELEETMVFAVERKGRGSITYMVDNPLFRGFWDNGLFLFSNAVFFVGN
ncbi:MAG: M14 family metallopeptidase [Saprospiraceae bacterium]